MLSIRQGLKRNADRAPNRQGETMESVYSGASRLLCRDCAWDLCLGDVSIDAGLSDRLCVLMDDSEHGLLCSNYM